MRYQIPIWVFQISSWGYFISSGIWDLLCDSALSDSEILKLQLGILSPTRDLISPIRDTMHNWGYFLSVVCYLVDCGKLAGILKDSRRPSLQPQILFSLWPLHRRVSALWQKSGWRCSPLTAIQTGNGRQWTQCRPSAAGREELPLAAAESWPGGRSRRWRHR